MVRELAAILAEDLKDTPPAMITFTRAEISRDLKQAKVYYSVYGDDFAAERGLEFLKRHLGVIRKMLGHRMRIKHNPEILFKYDNSSDNVLRINELLDKIKNEDDANTD